MVRSAMVSLRFAAILPVVFLFGCAHAAPGPASAEPPAFTTHVAGTGPAVILIPDLAAPGQVWDTTLAHLGGRFQTHVVEIAGFSENPPVDPPLLTKLRDQLGTYVREHQLHKPILVGHMFGAAVAYLLAMSEPDLVGGVVAIDAPPSRSDGSADDKAEAEEERKGLASAEPAKFQMMMTRRLASMMANGETA